VFFSFGRSPPRILDARFPSDNYFPMKLLFSFLLGLGFIYLFYKNLWCYSKVKGRELKIAAKYGKKSGQLLRFKKRFSTFKCSKIARFFLLLFFLIPAYLVGGKNGLAAFVVAVIIGNLLLFVWSVKKAYHN